MSVNHNFIYIYIWLSVNQLWFSINELTIYKSNICRAIIMAYALTALCQPANIAYIHSVFSQSTHHSAKQFVGQPSLHLYIQLSVFQHIIQQTNQALVRHRIFTFSSQSNKKITGNLSVRVPSYNKASRHATGLQEFYNPVRLRAKKGPAPPPPREFCRHIIS